MVLITGGARVGKTKLAINICKQRGQRVLYIASGDSPDDLFTREIVRRSRKQRPISWEIRERIINVGDLLLETGSGYDAVLVENIRVLTADLMRIHGYSEENLDLRILTSSIVEEINQLLTIAKKINPLVVFVTNEVNIYPNTADFFYKTLTDILGRVNQILAAACADVYWVASGIPVKIK